VLVVMESAFVSADEVFASSLHDASMKNKLINALFRNVMAIRFP
jgi:hypothetical protein